MGSFFVEGMNNAAFFGACHAVVDGFFKAVPDAAGQAEEIGPPQEFENRGSYTVCRLNLLEFEFIAPCDQRTPEQLIGSYDDENDDEKTGHQGADVARCSGGLQIAAEAGQLEVAVTHGEHFTGNQGKPAASDGDDG